jgi:hypothetical protein
MYVKLEDLETPEARKALANDMQADVRNAKEHFKDAFAQMLEDMYVAWHGCSKAWPRGHYKVNITQRFIRQKVASLYAKNPRVVAKRRQRLEYQLWDERPESLQQAMMEVQAAQQALAAGQMAMPNPNAMMMLQEIETVRMRQTMLDRLGRTLQTIYHYYQDEQIPSFKAQAKGCVQSAVQTGVGYVRLGFQRDTDLNPDNKAKIADHQARLAHIERLANEIDDGTHLETDAEAEELRLAIQELENQPAVIVREGLVFDWPGPTSIIPDPKCTRLKGWVGADWLAEEMFFTPEEIKEFYKLDLGNTAGAYKAYSTRGKQYLANPRADLKGNRTDLVCVWVVWHKPTGLKFTLADGVDDFLEEPAEPDVRLERFFPQFALTFNELVTPDKLFPPSDVRIMMPQQLDMNRARQARREHRRANLPKYFTPHGALDDEEKSKLGNDTVAECVEVKGMSPGQKVTDFLAPIPKLPIDESVYETESLMGDVMLSVGYQEAHFGGTSGSTATEASIAEASRSHAVEAEVDELNDFLTEIARCGGQVLLTELSVEEAKKIAGPGAVWPPGDRLSIAEEIMLEVVAGSNGRPNKAARQSALERLTPFLIQIPGVSPNWLAKMLTEAVDDSIDMSEAFTAGLPSILSMNDMAQMGTGNPEDDPNAQGPKGKSNGAQAPRPGREVQAPMGSNNGIGQA